MRRGEGGHGAGIDPAGEEHAERHVADKVLADRLIECRAEPVDRFVLVDREDGVERHVPVRLDLDLSVAVGEPVPGRQLANAAQDRTRRRHVLVREVQRQARQIELTRHVGMFQERAQLRTEHELIRQERVVERLDAEPVPRQHQRARRPVPEREREHAFEPVQHADAELLVAVDDHLGVGTRRERVSVRPELRGQLTIVVDLAVVDDPDATVLAGHGLMPGREVDDLKASHAESRRTIDEKALVVRAAMVDAIGHPLEHGAVGDAIRARQDVADDAAHQPSLRAGVTGIRSVGSAGERTSPPASMPTVSRTK